AGIKNAPFVIDLGTVCREAIIARIVKSRRSIRINLAVDSLVESVVTEKIRNTESELQRKERFPPRAVTHRQSRRELPYIGQIQRDVVFFAPPGLLESMPEYRQFAEHKVGQPHPCGRAIKCIRARIGSVRELVYPPMPYSRAESSLMVSFDEAD